MKFTILNSSGRPVADITSNRMTKQAAEKLSVQWFGIGSFVKVVK